MSVFAVHYSYIDDPDQLTSHRPAHRDFLRALADRGQLMAAAAYQDKPAGALLIVRADSARDVDLLLADDPFQQEGLVTKSEVRAWEPVIGPWAG